MLVLLVLLVVIVIAAAALVAGTRAGGHRLRRGREHAPMRRRPAARGRRERAAWADRRRSTDERVLLAEGEEIQQHVEARLSARGIAPHRLSGPNPPTAAERAAPSAPAPVLAPTGAAVYVAPGAPLPQGAYTEPYPAPLPQGAYAEPYPLVPGEPADPLVPGDPGYDARLVGGGRGRIGSRWPRRNLRG
jgi:hypothetical protein